MAASNKISKKPDRGDYRNIWHRDFKDTCPEDPSYFCYSLACGPCVSYSLRKRALNNDMSRYECCAGYSGCSGKCGESDCPKSCLCIEAFLCFGHSVASTRFLLRDEFAIRSTRCEDCIMGLNLIFPRGLGNVRTGPDCIAYLVCCLPCLCIQTQHKIEMDKRDGHYGPQPTAVPHTQNMSRIDQPYPPNVRYGQPSYGYPPAPPPQAGG